MHMLELVFSSLQSSCTLLVSLIRVSGMGFHSWAAAFRCWVKRLKNSTTNVQWSDKSSDALFNSCLGTWKNDICIHVSSLKLAAGDIMIWDCFSGVGVGSLVSIKFQLQHYYTPLADEVLDEWVWRGGQVCLKP